MPRAPVARRLFPPAAQTVVKALACERPGDAKRYPLARFSVADVCQRSHEAGIPMSYSTVWRLLDRDALRPWRQENWLFPKDPQFLARASPVLDLYHRRWEGEPLGPRDYVLCGDEMTNLQALSRIHPGLGPASGRASRVEFEYERHGTCCYLAFLDVFSGKVSGQTSEGNGIEPFMAALGRCLELPRYQAAERIFLILDNGSAHHPSTSPARIQAAFPQVTAVHLPVHASWLNQVEIYFSIVRRKALTPAHFASVAALEQRLRWFQWYYNQTAAPFQWNYTRKQLAEYLERLAAHQPTGPDSTPAPEAPRLTGAPAFYLPMN